MTRDALHTKLKNKALDLPVTPARTAFLEDLDRLILLDNDQSLQGITASTYLDLLDKLTDTDFTEYVTKYQKNTLNPW